MTQEKVNLPLHRVMKAYRPRAIRSKNRAQSWGYGVLYIMRRPLQSVSILMLSNSSRTRPKRPGTNGEDLLFSRGLGRLGIITSLKGLLKHDQSRIIV